MESLDIEKHNRETFRILLDTLAMPGSTKKIEKLFDSYLLSMASILLYSEVSYCNSTSEDFTTMDAITNSKVVKKDEADYIFCESLDDLFTGIKKGTHLSPEYSATLIVKVDSFEGMELILKGPGIDGTKKESYPVDNNFVEAFMKSNKNYPLGNEVYFLNEKSGELKALSRTTLLEVA